MPLSTLLPIPAPTVEDATPTTRGLRVLIAADRPADVEVLSLTLEAVGCQLVSAGVGQAAVDLTQLVQPEVVVVADGPGSFTVARAIADRSGWRKPFVVALTPPGSRPDDRLFREAGVHLAVERPVSPELLFGLIARFRDLLAGVEGFDPAI